MLDAIGGAISVIYHGTYEATGAGVDNLPGGKGWREEIERFPEASRHLHVHEGHCVEANAIDRRHMNPQLGAVTFTRHAGRAAPARGGARRAGRQRDRLRADGPGPAARAARDEAALA